MYLSQNQMGHPDNMGDNNLSKWVISCNYRHLAVLSMQFRFTVFFGGSNRILFTSNTTRRRSLAA